MGHAWSHATIVGAGVLADLTGLGTNATRIKTDKVSSNLADGPNRNTKQPDGLKKSVNRSTD